MCQLFVREQDPGPADIGRRDGCVFFFPQQPTSFTLIKHPRCPGHWSLVVTGRAMHIKISQREAGWEAGLEQPMCGPSAFGRGRLREPAGAHKSTCSEDGGGTCVRVWRKAAWTVKVSGIPVPRSEEKRGIWSSEVGL